MISDFDMEKTTFIDPLSDPGFKILFGRESNKDILIGFLNMLLDLDDDPITDLKYLDKEKVKEGSGERSIVYDIHCETECGKRFIVEMQNRSQNFFVERSIFYVSRAITEQGGKGNWRYDYMPVYGIFFTNFNIYGMRPKLRTNVTLADMENRKPFSDKLRLIYIQLPEFTKDSPEECENDFERWIYLLKNMERLVTMPFTDMNAVYRRIEEVSRVENLNAAERRQYERELKAYRDYNNQMLTAREEGLDEGRAEGRAEAHKLIVSNMKSQGLDNDEIARLVNMPLHVINEIVSMESKE